jgi:hypothetical protein
MEFVLGYVTGAAPLALILAFVWWLGEATFGEWTKERHSMRLKKNHGV